MKLKILVLLFTVFSTLSATFPVAHQGRFHPIETYTKLWLNEFYNKQEIQKADQDKFDFKNSAELAWHIHFNGIEPWQQSPLFWVQSAKLKNILNFEPKQNRFSYQQLHQAIYTNEKSNLQLIKALIPNAYSKAYHSPTNRAKSIQLELKELSAGLWATQQNGSVVVVTKPDQPLWKFIKQGTAFGPIQENQIQSEVFELIGKLQKFSFENNETGTDFKALPFKAKPGEWISLKALKNPDLKNFTPYSDSLFEQIRQTYLKRDLEKLGNLLEEGYAQIAGTPYLKSRGKTLYYPTQFQLKSEVLLYSYPWLIVCITLYLASILFAFFSMDRTSLSFVILAFTLHTLLLALRCYILARPPVSNMFETVIYVPWVAVLGGVTLRFFSSERWLLPAASLVSVLLLIVLQITQLNSQLENVQAVLDSQYWLIIHVLMVVGSYGLFALAGVLGHFYLIGLCFDKKETAHLKSIAKLIIESMYLGTALLIPGTILGGVWAAQSWGRFWDWDPKESWAFISSCIYLMWIHAYRFGHIKNFGLAVGSVVGLTAISFTWYGVNYILGTGLHSYGFGSGGELYYYLYLGAELLFIALMISLKKNPATNYGSGAKK